MSGAERRPPARRPRDLAVVALVALVIAGAWTAFAARADVPAAGGGDEATSLPATSDSDPELVESGRELYLQGCSSCHGEDARGRDGVAPSLYGAGAAAADFYLSTGRMPLDYPTQEPVRAEPRYPEDEIDALVAYVGSLGGPEIPEVDPEAGDISEGQRLFTTNCGGCHQVMARGGVVTGAFAPDLGEATPTEIGEAVRVGPYLMPRFSERELSASEVDSIARYVAYANDPEDPGGWAIGNLGPIPEGMVAWLIAIVALLLVARAIGERARA